MDTSGADDALVVRAGVVILAGGIGRNADTADTESILGALGRGDAGRLVLLRHVDAAKGLVADVIGARVGIVTEGGVLLA